MRYQREATFRSFEELNSFSHGWDVEFSTTTPRDYSASIRHAQAPGLLVNSVVLSSPTLQRGTAPAGMRTFALPLKMPNHCLWRSLPVSEGTLLIFPEDRELFSTMGADAEMMTVSLDEALVDSSLEHWALDARRVFSTPAATQLTREQHQALHRNLALVTEFMVSYGNHQAFPEFSRGVQEFLLENMLQPVLDSLESPTLRASDAAKRVTRATEYILTRLGGGLSVAEICDHIGCSRRSLEQSFRVYAGTSPKQFIKILRMEKCYKALLCADASDQVKRIATQHGFWHLGQFSADYKARFGELPSATLARIA